MYKLDTIVGDRFSPEIQTVPKVEFRKRGTKQVLLAEFATSADMQIYVDRHRAVAEVDAKGDVIPGKFKKLGEWDYFRQYVDWQPRETKPLDTTKVQEGGVKHIAPKEAITQL